MELLMVGEAPSRLDGEALSGAIGRRLAELMGLSLDDYLARFQRVNLLDELQERDGEGRRFNALLAAVRAAELRDDPRFSYYLLMGRRVAAAFGFRSDAHYLRWYAAGGKRYAVLPHPSGIVRWWGVPAHRRAARQFLQRLERATRPLALTAS